jgi:hypothetical protein
MKTQSLIGKRASVICLSLLVFTGCGGGNDTGASSSVAISNQTLSGKIGGQAWTLGTAESTASLSTGDQYFVEMYPDTFTACTTGGASISSNTLIVDLPKTAGSYTLGMNLTATFYIASTSENLATTSGRIQINSVTATTVTGGLNITYNADNTLDGQFQATICP